MLTKLFLSIPIIHHFLGKKEIPYKEFYELWFAGVILDQNLGVFLRNV